MLFLAMANPSAVARNHDVQGKRNLPQPMQAAPLSKGLLEQQPSSPPTVAYIGGQLTIEAKNSTLGDVLRAVEMQTKASFELPRDTTERVVGHFGPGRAELVLASLLNGSGYNYVMIGSEKSPNLLARVILTRSESASNASEISPDMIRNMGNEAIKLQDGRLNAGHTAAQIPLNQPSQNQPISDEDDQYSLSDANLTANNEEEDSRPQGQVSPDMEQDPKLLNQQPPVPGANPHIKP